jgi:ParB family chromosome partitioning protein
MSEVEVNPVSIQELFSPAIAGVELVSLPAAELHEHPKNPRRYFAEGPLEELAESIRKGGIRTPLIVWPRLEGSGYWILAGARRSRAAKLAGLKALPCLVKDCSEQEALEILTFENAQREDCHALEEAAGFRAYMEEALADVPDVAAKAGKSSSFVYGRLKLLDAIDEAQRACWDGIITPNHLERIARRTPSDQRKALQHCQPPSWDTEQRVSVRDLVEWMQKNLDLNLRDAPFSRDSEDLLPSAGSCAACPHRLGNAPDFDPVNDHPDACTRRECYGEKLAAHIEAERARVSAFTPDLVLVSELPNAKSRLPGVLYSDWREASGGLGKAALVVEGPRAGRLIRVYVQERIAPAAPVATPAAPAAKPPKKSAAEIESERARREEEDRQFREEQERQARAREDREKKLKAEMGIRLAILTEILKRVQWPPRKEDLARLLPHDLLAELPDALDPVVAEVCGAGQRFVVWADLPDAQFAKLCVLAVLADDLDDLAIGHGCDALHAAAKRYGVDVQAIRKRAMEAEGGTRKEVVAKLPTLGQTGKAAKAAHLPALKKSAAAKKAPAKKAAKPAPKKKAAPKGKK